MARKKDNDLLIEDQLASAFIIDEDDFDTVDPDSTLNNYDGAGVENEDELPGELAIDAYETESELIIKARTAGVDRKDLDVSISDNILTITGTLSSGNEPSDILKWHSQECYWGEFRRTFTLPVKVKEEGIKAELKDGVLTIIFEKVETKKPVVKVDIN